MDGQLDALFAQAPEMEANGFFWRYRAWLKYHLGLSAFRLGDEAAARVMLDSGIRDATRAREVAADNQSVFTYLRESAWGWYHVERGDAAAAHGDLPAALADYQFAFNLIQPKENADARKEKTQAAFRAGLAAMKLGRPERAAQWYHQGVTAAEDWNQHTTTPAERKTLRDTLEGEITKLQRWLGNTDDTALATAGNEILAATQAAYDRLVKP
jgi:tetratricopeptide (TPR) repeat protein